MKQIIFSIMLASLFIGCPCDDDYPYDDYHHFEDGLPIKFTSLNSSIIKENNTLAIILGATNAVTYSISEMDSKLFSVDSLTGIVKFKTAPDFEDPKDLNKDNCYIFLASASNSRYKIKQYVTIIVKDEYDGQLIDSEIGGVNYITNSHLEGVTDDRGTFKYNSKDTEITFKIGDLILVENFKLSKLKSDKKLLPADLFNLNRTNTTNVNLLKFIRVVQSLDNDNNLSNGIFIEEETKAKVNNSITPILNIKDANMTQLKTIITSAGKNLISEKKAREHYKKTLLNNFNLKPQFIPFETVWETISSNENITISINENYNSDYNYTIDWGDGNTSKDVQDSISHIYEKDGNHTVKIYGKFPTIQVSDLFGNAQKLKLINSWGDIKWKTFDSSFKGASHLELNTTDTPNLSNVINISQMFYGASSFNQSLNDWNVTNVIYMYEMFKDAFAFNQPLNNWNVSNVTKMWHMFAGAKAFNQPLNDWNVSNVTDMRGMFKDASVFKNRDLSGWDVKKVTKHGNFIKDSGGNIIEPDWKE